MGKLMEGLTWKFKGMAFTSPALIILYS